MYDGLECHCGHVLDEHERKFMGACTADDCPCTMFDSAGGDEEDE